MQKIDHEFFFLNIRKRKEFEENLIHKKYSTNIDRIRVKMQIIIIYSCNW
jgi:hypothetical protein